MPSFWNFHRLKRMARPQQSRRVKAGGNFGVGLMYNSVSQKQHKKNY